MRDVVICEPLRTAIGRYGGVLQGASAPELAVAVLTAVIDRTGLDPERIDDVILGHCFPSSEAPAIGRLVALDAGLPVEVPGLQVDRRCGSGLQSVLYAAMQIQSGMSDVIIAGGTESMSNAPYYSTAMRWGARAGDVEMRDSLTRGRITVGGKNHPVPGGMLETAENLRRDYGIGREEQDRFALRSHERAVAAQRSGAFAEEIVPVDVRVGKKTQTVDVDEHPRADTTLDALRGTPAHARSGGSGGNGHRGERERPERRRRAVHRDPPR